MPTISEFFGILIRMYYDDHNPLHFHAYFHAYYGGHEAIISIETLRPWKSWKAHCPNEQGLWSSNGRLSTGRIC
ncbi:DUF4160 domain-containing protein [Photorhabdus bodei]|nr:DUF4160 domain-containing protein [Photorhabdus bodei]